jgi:hypothetical protein
MAKIITTKENSIAQKVNGLWAKYFVKKRWWNGAQKMKKLFDDIK